MLDVRIQKARLKGMALQLEESKEMRKQLTDQISDLQKQLKGERDENKLMKKRCRAADLCFPFSSFVID